jgi:hypothetical protein
VGSQVNEEVNTQMQNIPDEDVVAHIVSEIRKEKLLPAKRLAALEEKLLSDGLAESDWILLADLSSNEET